MSNEQNVGKEKKKNVVKRKYRSLNISKIQLRIVRIPKTIMSIDIISIGKKIENRDVDRLEHRKRVDIFSVNE